MVCKNLCLQYKAGNKYKKGVRRCTACQEFIKWDGLWCPCCGMHLRDKPRPTTDSKRRKKENEMQTV